MRNAGSLMNDDVQSWTLYCLRHTFATFEILGGGTGIYISSKKMGNSAAKIGKNYLNFTGTMQTDRVA